MSKISNFSAVLLFLFLVHTALVAQSKRVELPMGFRGLMPTVEVKVNGKGPFVFGVDTGARGFARADSSLVEKLGLKLGDEATASDGAGKIKTMQTVKLDSIKVGDLEFKNIEDPTRDYYRSPGIAKIDGILCFDIFADYLLTLDYPGKKVVIERGALPPPNGSDILDFDNSRVIPNVELVVSGQKVRADIDSGNMSGGFLLPAEAVEKLQFIGEAKIIGKARTVTGEIEIKEAKLQDSIRLGKFVFKEPTVVFPAPANANIGDQILNRFVLTFDQKNHRVKLFEGPKTSETVTEKAPSGNSKTSDFVGQYGDRTISANGEDPYIQRPNGMKLKMKRLSRDEFTLEQIPEAKFIFIRSETGKVVKVDVLNQAGILEKVKKNQ